MTRKLRNSLNALLLASAMCGLGAVTVAAMPLGFDAETNIGTHPGVGMNVDMDATAPAKPSRAGRSHRMRPSLGMPYFSFVPRG